MSEAEATQDNLSFPNPTVVDIARFRQGAYRLLAACFLYPDQAFVEVIPETVEFFRNRGSLASTMAFSNDWASFINLLEGQGVRLENLQEEYMSLFGGSGTYKAIPLCESAYLERQCGPECINQMLMDYMEFEVVPIAGEVPDHLSVELEFLSTLCAKQAQGWEGEDSALLARAISCQKRFLEEHSPWLGALVKLIEARSPGGFYHRLGQISWAVVAQDISFVQILENLQNSE